MSLDHMGDLGYNDFPVSLNYITALPDVSLIPNPDIVVIFKSLSKKDPKTKEKALQELLGVTDVEDMTIISWIQMYPKLALDNSRVVRLLCHQIQERFLSIVGGKAFSKYLKSSLPIWLMGLYDTDKSVSSTAFKTLSSTFDSEKLEKTWMIFKEQIINLIATIINIETEETLSDKRYTNESEMTMKYNRALIGAINMLAKYPLEQVNVLNSDQVWDHMRTDDLALLRTLLSLIISMPNEAMESLYKLISKKFFKIKLKSSQPIIYSNVILQFWQSILKMTMFGIDHKLKKNFWDYGGSKASSKFYEYFKVGSCNLSGKYYELVKQVFIQLKEMNMVIDFTSQEEFDFIIGVLIKESRFKAAALDCIFTVIECFQVNTNFSTILTKVLQFMPRDNSEVLKVLSDNYKEDMKDCFVIEKPDQAIMGNYFKVLRSVGLTDVLEDIVRLAVEEASFDIIALYIQQESHPIPEVQEFLLELPSYLEEDHIDPVLNLFFTAKLAEIPVNDFFFKLSIVKPDLVDSFLQKLDLAVNKQDHPDIYSYLVEVSKRGVNETVIRLCKDKDILLNMDLTVDIINKYNLLSTIIDQDISLVMQSAWSSLNQQFLFELKQHQDKYVTSMMRYLKSTTTETDLLDFYEFVKDGPLPNFDEELQRSMEQIDKSTVAVSNPLALMVYLCHSTPGSINDFIPVIGNLLTHESNVSQLMLLVREYIADYLLIKENPSEPVVDVLSKLEGRIAVHFNQYTFAELIDSEGPLQSCFVLAEGNDVQAFYAARIIKRALENSVELESVLDYEIKTSLVKTPLKFAGIINGVLKFITKYDRLKNYIFSEILSVKKEEQIMSDGLTWVSLCLAFMQTGESSFPIHKLTMVFNLMNDWLDSTLAYDDEFIDMRVQLVRFLGYINQSDLPDVYYELTEKLIENNLEIIQLQPERLDLLYYTLKFIKQGFDQELLDIFLDFTPKENQASVLVQDTLHRALQRREVKPRKEQVMEIFSKSKLVDTQRMCAWYLFKIILADQLDFVVEYQLSKDDKQAEISSGFMNMINDKNFDITRYLWTWYLIFLHFEDVTLKIKSDYVNQISHDLLILLDFIFDYLQFDEKFFSTLIVGEENIIPQYDLIETSKLEPLDYELKYLAVNIYYKCVQYCGSQVQLWFKEIRDKQFKNKVEKFTINYVSPILISHVLDQVTKEKDRIQGSDENMKIKVNLVAKEIRLTYLIDDQKMEMVVRVPSNYPLDNVTVDGPLRLGVKENQWKAWLLASRRVISFGSIVEAIELFCKNVNLHFSGFEDCAICYSILHQDTSLPSKTCPTCSNKFHAACLYKWFKSSGSATCPLCRSAFNFKK